MSFPSYHKYKDSGVEWLGKMPEHWELKRLKLVFEERDERSVSGGETLLSVSAYTGVTPRSEIVDDGEFLTRAESLEGYKKCYPDDLVVNIMLAWNRGLAVTSYEGIVSPAYCVFRIKDGSVPKFINYLMRSDRSIIYFKAFSSGVIDSRLRIYPETFGSLFASIPSREEQSAIASFLDHETSKIDCLISEQEKLIELLKEKRQAVISHAVTKGLNDNVKMKDSGVEWLGKVPEHWEVTRSDSLIRTSRDSIDAAELSGREVYHYSIPVVQETGQGQVEDGSEIDSAKLVVSEPQVLVSKLNPRKGTICVAVPKDRLTVCSTEFVPVIPVGGDLSFLAYLVQTENYRCRLESMVESVTRSHQRVQPADVVRFHWAFPSLSEQSAIASFLDYETSKIDSLIKEAESVINLLQERRSALISAAVTGQIDVRDFVPPKAA